MKGQKIIPPHDHLKFLSKITVLGNGCWTIGRTKRKDSYSHYYIQSEQFLSHRVAFEVFKGPLIKGLVIDHTCINRICCNPDHLRQVTQKENLLENTRCKRVNRLRDKNECKVGHKLEGENLILFKRSGSDKTFRLCRECNRKKCKERYHKRIKRCV